MFFTPWEKATHVPAAAAPGLLPTRTSAPLTAFSALAITILLWPSFGLSAPLIGLLFGRLLALDITTYTLPNIYTVPLIAIGFAYALLHGQFTQAVLAALLLFLFNRILVTGKLKVGLGGGDIKLLIALFAFLPLTSAFWAISLGCLLWLPFTFVNPRKMVPFGVPLIAGWVIFIRWPHLPNWLISTIS